MLNYVCYNLHAQAANNKWVIFIFHLNPSESRPQPRPEPLGVFGEVSHTFTWIKITCPLCPHGRPVILILHFPSSWTRPWAHPDNIGSLNYLWIHYFWLTVINQYLFVQLLCLSQPLNCFGVSFSESCVACTTRSLNNSYSLFYPLEGSIACLLMVLWNQGFPCSSGLTSPNRLHKPFLLTRFTTTCVVICLHVSIYSHGPHYRTVNGALSYKHSIQ